VSAETIDALRKQSEPPETFSILNCAENTYRQGGNLVTAMHFVCSSSAFEAMDKNLVGAAVTNSSIFVGNRGPNNDAMFWVHALGNCMQKTPDPQLLMNVEAM